MPRYTKYMCGFYIGSVLAYNTIGSYLHAKKALQQYREDRLPYHVKTEWDAVKYGSNQHGLLDSIFWPITLSSNIAPFVALMVNPKEDSSHNSLIFDIQNDWYCEGIDVDEQTTKSVANRFGDRDFRG